MGNFEPTSLNAVGNWHFNFSPPILQLVTSLPFNQLALWKLLVALVRRARLWMQGDLSGLTCRKY